MKHIFSMPFIFALISSAFAYVSIAAAFPPAPLPQTGQTTCSDGVGVAGATVLVSVPVQGDADGTVIGFSNGMASALLSGGVMRLGDATVSSGGATTLNPALQ